MLGAGLLPEAGPLDDKNVSFYEQLFHKCRVILRNINLRKRIERTSRRHATHPRNGIACLDCDVASRTQLLAHFDQVVLRSFERNFDRILLRMIGREPRPQQLVNAFGERLHGCGLSAYNTPAYAPSWSQ